MKLIKQNKFNGIMGILYIVMIHMDLLIFGNVQELKLLFLLLLDLVILLHLHGVNMIINVDLLLDKRT